MTIKAPESPKTKKIQIFDPTLGRMVERTVEIPPRADVKAFPSGLTVEEIKPEENLDSVWGDVLTKNLTVPLASHSRGVLKGAILNAITDPDEQAAITDLCETWQVNDDRALKLIGRLLVENRSTERKVGMKNAAVLQLKHEKALWEQERSRLKQENKDLHADVKKVVNERDAIKRDRASDAEKREAKLARDEMHRERGLRIGLEAQLAQTQSALTDAINEKAALTKEREAYLRNAKRDIKIALIEYESEVMKKLDSVAEDHNKKAQEVVALKTAVSDLNKEITKLKSERIALQEQVKQITQVKKEREMSENENTTEAVLEDVLGAGDQVFCKVSGEGPFVLMTQVDEGQVEYSNPIANKKNAYSVGKLPVYDAWLVRCKDGSFRTLPAPALTKTAPKRKISFGGLKNLVTSDVSSKLFQAAIWITMLTLLAMNMKQVV